MYIFTLSLIILIGTIGLILPNLKSRYLKSYRINLDEEIKLQVKNLLSFDRKLICP